MKKTFDAVAFMRRRREELSREYEGHSWDEQERETETHVLMERAS